MNRQYVQRVLRLKPNNIEKYIPLARFVIQLKCLGQGRYKGGGCILPPILSQSIYKHKKIHTKTQNKKYMYFL